MPLQKILFKPGVNRENTRYTTEGGVQMVSSSSG